MENDEYVANEDAASEPQPSDPTRCDKCDRIFASAWGLRVHNVRKHSGRGWDTTANLPLKSRQLIYQRRLRARYKAEGLTSKGKPLKRYPSDSSEYKKRKYAEKKAWNYSHGLNARGAPFRHPGNPKRRMQPIVYSAPLAESLDAAAPKTVTELLTAMREILTRLEMHLS